MKKLILIIFIFIFTTKNYSQTANINFSTKSDFGLKVISTLIIFSPLNPMLVVENKKAYFGLTKEISSIIPVHLFKKAPLLLKPSFEYSYIFRSERTSHLRAGLDIGYPIVTSDFAAVLFFAGGGYFSDTKKSGITSDASLNFFAPIEDYLGLSIYLKVRGNYMLKKEESNIFDASIGISTVIYPF